MRKIQKKGGIVGNLVFGVGGLIILTIVVLVVVSTLLNANLLRSTATVSTVTNEQGFLNGTFDLLNEWNSTYYGYAIANVTNRTNGVEIASANYTLNATTGKLQNATSYVCHRVNITYTYTPLTDFEKKTNALGDNFNLGLDNVSSKIPTILLIGAVVLLFGVIVLLIKASKGVGIGGQQGSL